MQRKLRDAGHMLARIRLQSYALREPEDRVDGPYIHIYELWGAHMVLTTHTRFTTTMWLSLWPKHMSGHENVNVNILQILLDNGVAHYLSDRDMTALRLACKDAATACEQALARAVVTLPALPHVCGSV